MGEQLNLFDDYLKNKNKEYAKGCRRCLHEYCYAKKKELNSDAMCPCDNFEPRLSCIGCKHAKKGSLRFCLSDNGCKRYCFSPCVSSKDNPDKYET